MAGDDLVELKFRLYDGTDIGPNKYAPASTVATLKESILSQWPQGDDPDQPCCCGFQFQGFVLPTQIVSLFSPSIVWFLSASPIAIRWLFFVLFFHGQIVCSWPTIQSPGEILQSVNSRVYPLHVDLSIVAAFVAPLVAVHTFSCGSTIYLLEGFGSQFSQICWMDYCY